SSSLVHLPGPWEHQHGRISLDNSNSHESNLLEYEAFDVLRPRGPLDEGLSVLSVDMRVAENRKDHYTDKFKSSSLIVRRNKEFTIIIKLDRAFSAEQDDVQVEFLIGSSPNENKGTYITVSIGKGKHNRHWKGRVVEMQGNEVTVGITPDASCIIGRFRTFVAIVTDFGRRRTQRNQDTDFYVLFNPWDPADQVYMDKEEDRQEYVMNDVGIIYNGEYNNITSRSWNFGQFEEGVLDACLMVMDAGKVPLLFRGNATEVVRQGSALLNAQDDKGVMVGNWSGDYSSGTAPTAWTGSPEILLKYASEGCEPVCFVQCWVFAGVMNTFMRCLGIPARVITNFFSAHDNTGNVKTDIVLDKDGKIDRSRTKDSVWNYHCWNEVYMKRPDLPENFSGWQVVDCTPQETSDGLYRCGPTSVNAIKEGELSYPFDAKFVFAEVKSMSMFLLLPSIQCVVIVENANILPSTSMNLGSLKERETMQMAERRGVSSRDYLPPAEAGVTIELQADTIKMATKLLKCYQFCVPYASDVQPTVCGCFSNNSVTSPGWDFFVKTVNMTGSPMVGKELMVSVEFLNPYNFILQKVHLRIDGPGLIPTKLKYYSQILPGASVTYKVLLIPRLLGKKVLMVCLDCPLLRQVTNQLEFVVKDENRNDLKE
uniref:Coagulation factor XIII A chain-like n=1 Tax=Sinocyclocheilus rhinocerous TaxID=307959 RepID=A0A673LN04_9TELE